jgi:uncharacterized protein YdhG (YjbR/CyaY superfamily)
MEGGRKMQNVQFRSIDELSAFLPKDQLEIVERLRELVTECIPDVEERLSFNVPFYRRLGAVCFIWPGAVPWGSKTREGVEFGFNYGNLLSDEGQYLDKGTRKQVFSKRFFSAEEIREDVLRNLIFEAVEVDELLFAKKRKRNNFK